MKRDILSQSRSLYLFHDYVEEYDVFTRVLCHFYTNLRIDSRFLSSHLKIHNPFPPQISSRLTLYDFGSIESLVIWTDVGGGGWGSRPTLGP